MLGPGRATAAENDGKCPRCQTREAGGRKFARAGPSDGLERHPPQGRHLPGDLDHEGGLVALAAVRRGGQERRVGLDQEPVERGPCAPPPGSTSARGKATMPEKER